ncbi:hypothetical protein R5R35_011824 [Gryllus longicercus]|uniref:Rho GTPase-activating protein 26 n=1 Tax=Gryllus longicercus TaxID=2509291 RepID=A0AAN9ZI77_9ORTH
MGVGLKPLEFYECLGDSPYFREKLHAHEQELQRTSHQIKGLIRELKDLLAAAKHLSKAQRTLSHSLQTFDFPCIGDETDDEMVIAKSLKDLGNLIAGIEDHRDIMLDHAYDQIILPLERFRKEHIGGVKEGKKKFEKQTAKFCMSQERYLNLSTKKQDTVLKEADAALAMEQRHFVQASLEYVFLLQEVQERKKFEFVETLLRFMFSWLTFYHQGHEVACDFKPVMNELQLKLQKTRANFEATRDQAESLRNKILERAMSTVPPSGEYTREGYLYLLEKKAFGSAWTKQYCMYNKDKKEFSMLPYNQTTGKFNPIETVRLTSCVRRMSDSIEKRFCFDITVEGKPGLVFTLQALSEEDRKLWMDAMDGKEPMYAKPGKVNSKSEERPLDDIGFMFVKRCIEVLESRGLEEQGLYRLVGLSSKVTKLLQMGLDRRKSEAQAALGALDDQYEWESKTITSALKTYLRNLPEPLMTFRYHSAFIAAAKQESKMRVQDVHTLVHRLPQPNFQMLDILIKHLKNVSTHSERNLMTVSNLSMCFGPTLLRPEEETVAAIMDIKFYNVVVEVLIMNYDRIFKNRPEVSSVSPRHDRSPSSQNISPRTQTQAPSTLQTVQQETRPSPPPPVITGNGSVVHHNHLPVERQPKFPPPYPLGPPPITHAVIKTYHDGPMPVSSASMINVASLRGDHRESGGGTNHHSGYPPQGGGGSSRMIGGGGGLGSASGMVGMGDHHSNNLSHHKLGSTTSLAGRISHGNIVTLSESNLLSLGSQQPIYGSPHHSKMAFLYGSRRDVSTDRADQSQSNSSSNESVSSSPRDLGNHTGYAPIISPQKYRGGQMESHYAKSYRPFHDARVRTLYACLGENDGELSFEPNQIITNVRSSMEPGWLEGTLNGKTGLVPENYVEFLP